MSGKLDFKELYKEFQPKMRYYLSRLAGPAEAEDLTQEVFEKVSRGLEGFKGESKLSTWLYRVATNTALDRLRTSSFRRASDKPHLKIVLEFRTGTYGLIKQRLPLTRRLSARR